MVGPFGQMLGSVGDLARLAQDENFRRFLSHPKVQTLMQDESFKRAVEEKNVFQLMSNPEFHELLKDSEVRNALEKLSKSFKKDS